MTAQLRISTVHGPVEGFADTFPAGDRSSFNRVANGEDGGRPAVLKWLGIPYAQAERWARPRPPSPWTDPLECSEFGSYFPQPPSMTNALLFRQTGVPTRSWSEPSEDSFTVNVFAPRDTRPDEKLPVLAWIYGGSLNTGTAVTFVYDPTELIRREVAQGKRFIVVTANYRVNTFGFLASQDLKEGDPEGLAGNYGLYDAAAYLTWVQENIASFGGDPTNVTVFGESAGGFLISALLVHPAPLFKRAILQSGFPTTMTVRPIEAQEKLYADVLQHFNVSPSTHPTAASRVAALAEISSEALGQVKAPPLAAFGLTLETGPHAIWTSHPGKMIKEGKIRKGVEAVVVGINKDEGSLFAKLIGLGTTRGYKGWLGLYPPQVQPQLEKMYPPPKDGDEARVEVLTQGGGSLGMRDGIFHVPMEHFADSLVANGVPVYAYRFDAVVERVESTLGLGATHALDVPFSFNAESIWKPESPEAAVSAALGRILADTTLSGSLGPDWPTWTPEERRLLVIGRDGTLSPDELGGIDPGTRRAFWTQMIEEMIKR